MSLAGLNAAAGQQIQIYNGSDTVGSALVLSQADINNGAVSITLSALAQGTYGFKAQLLTAGGALLLDGITFAVTVDTTAPTLSSSAPTTALGAAVAGTPGNSAGETITLTVTFDGNVNGLTSGTDNTIFNVAGVPTSAIWGGTTGTPTRTLTYTIQAGQNGQAAIDEAALKAALIAGVRDYAGNAFTYTANSGTIADIDASALPVIDTTAPTATLTTATLGNTASATVQSTEAGTAYLVRSDVAVTNLASITGAAANL